MIEKWFEAFTLMEKQGRYYELFSTQARRYVEGTPTEEAEAPVGERPRRGHRGGEGREPREGHKDYAGHLE